MHKVLLLLGLLLCGPFFEVKAATEIALFMQDFDQAKDGLWPALQGREIVGAVVIVGREAEKQGRGYAGLFYCR